MVGAQHLGVPLIVTRSTAVVDYVSDETARLVAAGSQGELIAALVELVEDRETVVRRRDRARAQAADQNCPLVWVKYLTDACQRLVQ